MTTRAERERVTIIDVDVLAEEAAEDMEVAETQAQTTAIKWRYERQLALLRLLPEGWRVERNTHDQLIGSVEYTVVSPQGSRWARRQRAADGPRISWPNGGGTYEHGFAQVIAIGLTALDAEARSE